jgi:DHA1 family tetracycline resistance protein-like MFS transporter
MTTEEQEPFEVESNPLGAEPELVRPADGSATTMAVPEGRRAAATFIFLTVAMDMLALGMIAPVLPRLITGFLGGNAVNAAQMLGLFGRCSRGSSFCFRRFSVLYPTGSGGGQWCCCRTSGWGWTIC